MHLQQKIAKQQNHNQINYYEYHYQFFGVTLNFSKSTLTLLQVESIEPTEMTTNFSADTH